MSFARIAAALGLTLALLGGAQAAPVQTAQAPGFQRMALGDFVVTALYDGYVDLDPKVLTGASPQDIQRLLADMFAQHASGMQTAVTGYLVHTGAQLLLVDTGTGHCFGPTLGQMENKLRAAGYTPADVDAVLLTHLHPAHACGLITPDGQARERLWIGGAHLPFPGLGHVRPDGAGYV